MEADGCEWSASWYPGYSLDRRMDVERRKACRFHCSSFSVLQVPYVKIILRKRRENKWGEKRRKYEKEWKEGTNTKK